MTLKDPLEFGGLLSILQELHSLFPYGVASSISSQDHERESQVRISDLSVMYVTFVSK